MREVRHEKAAEDENSQATRIEEVTFLCRHSSISLLRAHVAPPLGFDAMFNDPWVLLDLL